MAQQIHFDFHSYEYTDDFLFVTLCAPYSADFNNTLVRNKLKAGQWYLETDANTMQFEYCDCLTDNQLRVVLKTSYANDFHLYNLRTPDTDDFLGPQLKSCTAKDISESVLKVGKWYLLSTS